MAQIVVNTNPGATITYMRGCTEERCENGSDDLIVAVGRNFIPSENIPGLYTCVFVAFGGSDKPVTYKNVGQAKTANRLVCKVPKLTGEKIYEAEFGVTLTIVEGPSTAVAYLGNDEPVFPMRAGGPVIAHIGDITIPMPDDDLVGKVEVKVTDVDSVKFEFAVESEGDIIKDISVSKKAAGLGLIVYTIKSGTEGEAVITVTVTDDHKNEQSHSFTITILDPPDDNIHVVRCEEITVTGAGGQGAVVNGVYRKVPSYFEGWPMFCKVWNNKPFCHLQSGNRGSRLFSYATGNYGIQTNSGCGMHHRYYAQGTDGVQVETLPKSMTRIRGHGNSCVGGSNPTPKLACTKESFKRRVDVDPGPIDASKCKTIAVWGQIGDKGKCPRPPHPPVNALEDSDG